MRNTSSSNLCLSLERHSFLQSLERVNTSTVLYCCSQTYLNRIRRFTHVLRTKQQQQQLVVGVENQE